jgi:16S rRNA (guanine527-N7)-methyltransferase
VNQEFERRLKSRARRVHVEMPPALRIQLARYLTLLASWNRKINLTSLDDPDEAIDRLVMEPLIAARRVPKAAERILDLGTGGGSPAVPMKLALPRLGLTMVESKTRKSAFLREVVRCLALADTVVETSRFEELLARPELLESMDLVTVRAVRVGAGELHTFQAFLRPGGRLFLFRDHGTSAPDLVRPPLMLEGEIPLVERLRSRLVILRKSQ